jgi:hypothetical protein
MEFVRVLYPSVRSVEIDNTIVGQTNQILLVETGMHRFDLGQPVDYEPRFKDVNVVDTTPANPMALIFDTIVAAVTADTKHIEVKTVTTVTETVTTTSMVVPAGETPEDKNMTRGSME